MDKAAGTQDVHDTEAKQEKQHQLLAGGDAHALQDEEGQDQGGHVQHAVDGGDAVEQALLAAQRRRAAVLAARIDVEQRTRVRRAARRQDHDCDRRIDQRHAQQDVDGDLERPHDGAADDLPHKQDDGDLGAVDGQEEEDLVQIGCLFTPLAFPLPESPPEREPCHNVDFKHLEGVVPQVAAAPALRDGHPIGRVVRQRKQLRHLSATSRQMHYRCGARRRGPSASRTTRSSGGSGTWPRDALPR